ncbi:MAG: hypothetical protein KAJ19_15275 [Gammaproteobacteria bacterium]|nr:hypothetical protein [Gammaproteobacteria bacterium]
MTLSDFHSMVRAAMELQGELAKSDEREDDKVTGWYEEFNGILRDNVTEVAAEGEEDDDVD